jgi:hypothetical protein
MKKILSDSAILELKQRVTKKFGSMEKLAAHLRESYGIEISSGTIHRMVNGNNDPLLTNTQAVAHALDFESTDQAFPPQFLNTLKDGKEKDSAA